MPTRTCENALFRDTGENALFRVAGKKTILCVAGFVVLGRTGAKATLVDADASPPWMRLALSGLVSRLVFPPFGAQRPRFPPHFPAFWSRLVLFLETRRSFGNEALSGLVSRLGRALFLRPRRHVRHLAAPQAAFRYPPAPSPSRGGSAHPLASIPLVYVCVCGRVCVGGVVVGVSIATRTTAGTTLGSSATPR